MSLAVLADELAAKGRHGDDLLVHMSRDEVEHLQKLAKAHGLTLTINPETGLPEAFSLKQVIKAVAPIALGAVLGPAGFGMSSFGASLAVGGIGALATGSLEKGLMMGLGAYGGAGLGESFMGAGKEAFAGAQPSTAVASPEVSAAAQGTGAAAPAYNYQAPALAAGEAPQTAFRMSEIAAQNAPVETLTQMPAVPEVSGPSAQEAFRRSEILTGNAQAAQDSAWKALSNADKLKYGAEGVMKDPMAFAKANTKPGLAALYSAAALGQETPELPKGQNRQGYIRNYGYDPYSGVFTPGKITPTSAYAAEGGLMGYNGGGIVALAEGGAAQPTDAQENLITNIYQNTLGRDPDAEGLQYWSGRLAAGESPTDVYSALQASANYVLGDQAATLAPNINQSYEQATTPYTGYRSSDAGTIGDEWIRNVLGRQATATDRSSQWYQDLANLGDKADVEYAYQQFLQEQAAGKKAPTSWFEASQLRAPQIKPMTPGPTPTTGNLPGWTYDPNATVGSGLIRPEERAGETTNWTPGSGTTPTMQDVVNRYTQGGGMTGRLPYVPKSLAEQEQLYNRLTGSSKSAYDYLQGRTSQYPTRPNVDQIAIPYGQAAMGLPASTYNTRYIFDPATKSYIINPNYKQPELPTPGDKTATTSAETPATGMADGGLAELAGYSPQEMASVGRPTEGYASSYGVRPKKKVGYTPSVFDESAGGGNTAMDPAAETGWGNAVAAAMGNLGGLASYGIGALGNAIEGPSASPAGVSDAYGTASYGGWDAAPGGYSMGDIAAGYGGADVGAGAGYGGAGSDGFGGDYGAGDVGGADAGGADAGGADAMARGGYAHGYAGGGGIYNLGGYSDGGRLLKGPGDGVSDSIPATIGDKQPARLADGEFVIPARIVSELGNGSTDAGARKLYAMMDRIQARRGKTTGKGKVAMNSRADKLLPV